ncbi:hypothetical protein ACFVAO_12670 [Streptomyces californicus]|uniref:hypothetical protein n=1 Tax=Streptomyces californicus TaxID=67351 RepID=UPI00367C426D
MKKPNRIVTFLYRLVGMSYVHTSVPEVREALTENLFGPAAERWTRIHAQGAEKLHDPLAFQPGLIDLHAEMHDMWLYLTALRAQAQRGKSANLADELEEAADFMGEVLHHVGLAAEVTVPWASREEYDPASTWAEIPAPPAL